MDGLTLRYTTSTTLQAEPEAEPETTEGTLRVSLAATEIIVDDGEEARRVDFERRRTTILRHGTRTARDSALLGAWARELSGGAVVYATRATGDRCP